jgi:hypothetical protein
MDGFERLIETPMWKKLKIAKEAVFELEGTLMSNGFSTDLTYSARCKLTDLENDLRRYFKSGRDN